MADGDGVTEAQEAPPAAPAAPAAPEQLAVTVPPTMTIIGNSLKQNRAGTVYWESVDVKRVPAIAQSKFAAVRSTLNSYGYRNRLLISNAGPINMATFSPTATRFRIRLAPALTDAGMTSFLAAVDTAAT